MMTEELRLECLRIAATLPTPGDVLQRAREFFAFISPESSSSESSRAAAGQKPFVGTEHTSKLSTDG